MTAGVPDPPEGNIYVFYKKIYKYCVAVKIQGPAITTNYCN